MYRYFGYNLKLGAWRSGLARMVWDHEVVGSNPTAPMIYIYNNIEKGQNEGRGFPVSIIILFTKETGSRFLEIKIYNGKSGQIALPR